MSCSGRCCEYFQFGLSPEQIKQRAEIAAGGDYEKVASMVIPLFAVHSSGDTTWFYTCKHFDKQTRKCMDYDNRPKMCRNYPEGVKCGHSNLCTEKGINERSTNQR